LQPVASKGSDESSESEVTLDSDNDDKIISDALQAESGKYVYNSITITTPWSYAHQ
jgi:hypothetical protein